MQYVDQSQYYAGVVTANTTNSRDGLPSYSEEEIIRFGNGGLSGNMLYDGNIDRVKLARQHTDKAIISVGGIDSPEKVTEALQSRANACQVYTGFVYKGPRLVTDTLEYLNENNILSNLN